MVKDDERQFESETEDRRARLVEGDREGLLADEAADAAYGGCLNRKGTVPAESGLGYGMLGVCIEGILRP